MKFKNIFLGLIAGTILTASLTACTSTKNPDDNTKPTETETIEKINEPYSDTDPSTWKDLTEPSFLYPHWQTYNKWPSWYNPLRPWEKEGSVNFDFSQIMLEDYNGEGDAITWDGRVIPNGYNGEPLDPLNIVHSQLYTYIENITTQDTHEEQCSHVYGYLTKERILEEYNLYKPTNERYYLQSISYYYEDENKNPLSTSQSFYPDYEKEYEYNYLYNSEINAYKESKKFDAVEFINSIPDDCNVTKFEIWWEYFDDDYYNEMIKIDNVLNYIEENNLTNYDFSQYYSYGKVEPNEDDFIVEKHDNAISIYYDESKSYIQRIFDYYLENNYPIFVEGFNANYMSYFGYELEKNSNYERYYEEKYSSIADRELTTEERAESFIYGLNNLNIFNYKSNDDGLSGYFFDNLTANPENENVDGVNVNNAEKLKFLIGKSYFLKIDENGIIRVIANDDNVFNTNPTNEAKKQEFAQFVINYIMQNFETYQMDVNLNLNFAFGTMITLNQLSNGDLSYFQYNGVIGQNGLGSSNINIADRKNYINAYGTNDKYEYSNDGMLSFVINTDYSNHFTRYFDYKLRYDCVTYDYYYMNYQNYKYNENQTEYGPAYLKYKMTLQFTAEPVEHEIINRYSKDKKNYSANYISLVDYGKFYITIEYDGNPDTPKNERMKYTLNLITDTRKSTNEKYEKMYLNWIKTNDYEAFVFETNGNAQDYEVYDSLNDKTLYQTSDNSNYTNGNYGVNYYQYKINNKTEIKSTTNINVKELSYLTQNDTTPTLYEGIQNYISVATINNED